MQPLLAGVLARYALGFLPALCAHLGDDAYVAARVAFPLDARVIVDEHGGDPILRARTVRNPDELRALAPCTGIDEDALRLAVARDGITITVPRGQFELALTVAPHPDGLVLVRHRER